MQTCISVITLEETEAAHRCTASVRPNLVHMSPGPGKIVLAELGLCVWGGGLGKAGGGRNKGAGAKARIPPKQHSVTQDCLDMCQVFC